MIKHTNNNCDLRRKTSIMDPMNFHNLRIDFKVNIEKIVDDESSNLENYKLTCFACGEEIDWNIHTPKSEVKAITFHKMCVKEDNGVFKLRAILDL